MFTLPAKIQPENLSFENTKTRFYHITCEMNRQKNILCKTLNYVNYTNYNNSITCLWTICFLCRTWKNHNTLCYIEH